MVEVATSPETRSVRLFLWPCQKASRLPCTEKDLFESLLGSFRTGNQEFWVRCHLREPRAASRRPDARYWETGRPTGMAPNPTNAQKLFDRALLTGAQARARRGEPAFLLERVAEVYGRAPSRECCGDFADVRKLTRVNCLRKPSAIAAVIARIGT